MASLKKSSFPVFALTIDGEVTDGHRCYQTIKDDAGKWSWTLKAKMGHS